MLSIRDYLIVLITSTSHKAHLLSCALRCLSKLQKIQNSENFVSIAIQGIQIPMYTCIVNLEHVEVVECSCSVQEVECPPFR